MADRQPAAALQQLGNLTSQGAQPGQLADQLLDIWRGLLFSSVGAGEPPIELSTPITPQLAAAAVEELIEVTRSAWPLLSLEATIVRLAQTEAGPASVTTTSRVPLATKASPAEQAEPKLTGDPELGDRWPKALLAVKEQSNNNPAALLKTGKVQFEPDEVILQTRFNFHRDRITEPKNLRIIEQAVAKAYGKPLKVKAQINPAAAPPVTPQAAGPELGIPSPRDLGRWRSSMAKTTRPTRMEHLGQTIAGEASGKLPPQNTEAEASLLGSLLIEKEAIIKVADIVGPDDFYVDRHGLIYAAMLDLYEQRQPLDLLTLSNKLSEQGELERLGGIELLNRAHQRGTHGRSRHPLC